MQLVISGRELQEIVAQKIKEFSPNYELLIEEGEAKIHFKSIGGQSVIVVDIVPTNASADDSVPGEEDSDY